MCFAQSVVAGEPLMGEVRFPAESAHRRGYPGANDATSRPRLRLGSAGVALRSARWAAAGGVRRGLRKEEVFVGTS
jgi:hypothetical protein